MKAIARIKEICTHYSKITGIDCKVLDISKCGSNNNCLTCDFCNKLQDTGILNEKCEDVFRYSYYQAERFGGKYIFFCSTGLAYWCSEVRLEDGFNGVIVAGPVMPIDTREFIEDEIFSKVKTLDPKITLELFDLANKLPKIEPDQITSLSEILNGCIQNEVKSQGGLQELDKNIVDNIKGLKLKEKEISTYSIEKEKELLSAIKQSNEKKSKEILNEILASLFVTRGMDLKILRNRVYELTVLLSRAVMEVGVEREEVFGINCRLLDDIYNIDDLDDLLRWSNNILNKFMDLVFGLKDIKNKDIIFKSIAYINKNYMCHITLEEVADHIALSPAYFSSLFKKDMRVNFSDYLNKVRIDNSKRLLLDSRIKLVEVAYLVGFESQSYFTKVFKKSEGITPKQYRQANVVNV